MKRSLPPSPALSPPLLAGGTRGPLCSEPWWGEPPWPGHVPSIPCSLLETPPHLPHPLIHGRTPLCPPSVLSASFQTHQPQFSLSTAGVTHPSTSRAGTTFLHSPGLAQPPWHHPLLQQSLSPCRHSGGVTPEQGDPCTWTGLKLVRGEQNQAEGEGGRWKNKGRVSPCRNNTELCDGSSDCRQEEGSETLPGQRVCHPRGMTDEPDKTLRTGEVWQLPGPWQSEEEPLNTDWSVCKTQITPAWSVQGTDTGGTAGRDWSGDKTAWSNPGHRIPSLCHDMKGMSA